MNKTISFVVAALVALAPIALTAREHSNPRKEAAAAYKELRKAGYKPVELGNTKDLLEKYFIKVDNGCQQIVGTSENCMSSNLAQISARNNAVNMYAMLAGGKVRSRIVSTTSSISGAQTDDIIAAFERFIIIDLKGELVTGLVAVKENGDLYSARAYCLVDYDSAAATTRRALTSAIESQGLASEYGSMISDWIDEGEESSNR